MAATLTLVNQNFRGWDSGVWILVNASGDFYVHLKLELYRPAEEAPAPTAGVWRSQDSLTYSPSRLLFPLTSCPATLRPAVAVLRHLIDIVCVATCLLSWEFYHLLSHCPLHEAFLMPNKRILSSLPLCPMTIPSRLHCSYLFTCLSPHIPWKLLGGKNLSFSDFTSVSTIEPEQAAGMIVSLPSSMIALSQERAVGVGIFRGDILAKKWSLITDHIQVILFLPKAKKAY